MAGALNIWTVKRADPEEAQRIAKAYSLSSLASRVLAARKEDPSPLFVNYFLSDPFGLKDMDKGARILAQCVGSKKHIAVCGDYDADGVTAVSIVRLWLESHGITAQWRVPDRFTEGYGLSENAVRELAETGTDLLITVDCGIACREQIALARSLGMKVIVTDHHQCPETLPEAEAVIDPQREDSPEPYRILAGCGVALKLICAAQTLLDGFDRKKSVTEAYCDLAALGTVADVMPLTGENRYIVNLGLEKLRTSPRPGLGALLRAAGADTAKISSRTLSFTLAPRINAAGRMDHAALSVGLLCVDDEYKCTGIAERLCALNDLRKKKEEEVLKSASAILKERILSKSVSLLAAGSDGWHPGVTGIAAARITEATGLPTVLAGFDDNGLGRGSCRSVEGFDIGKALSSCADILEEAGGHGMAAGFTVKKENFALLAQRLEELARVAGITPGAAKKIDCDCELEAEDLCVSAAKSLEALEPFGEKNPVPLFLLAGARVISADGMSEGKHTRLLVEKDGAQITANCFRMPRDKFPFRPGDEVDLAGTLEINEFRQSFSARLNVKNVRTHTAI
ncbi:MAG: single-stranded-DNA-specific exonuclease RecJ [Clostridia bacterium]|nr:single-stranded-DNA-specific exonuclease RecJ [Clostridia bacterium]